MTLTCEGQAHLQSNQYLYNNATHLLWLPEQGTGSKKSRRHNEASKDDVPISLSIHRFGTALFSGNRKLKCMWCGIYLCILFATKIRHLYAPNRPKTGMPSDPRTHHEKHCKTDNDYKYFTIWEVDHLVLTAPDGDLSTYRFY